MTSILRHPASDRTTDPVGTRARGSRECGIAPPNFAVIDVETTGLDPADTRMVEIAIVEMNRAGHRIDEFSTLLSIPGEGPLGADFIHRISRPMLSRAPRFEEVAGTICQRLAGRIIVGHVIDFDVEHLGAEFTRAGLVMPSLAGSTLCTRDLARVVLPAGPKTLAACCEATGIRHRAAHTALGDARATARLLATMLRSFDARLQGLSDAAAAVVWPELDAAGPSKQRSRFGSWLGARRSFSPPQARER
jgi:DNA polymerase-3 subunit epsilon